MSIAVGSMFPEALDTADEQSEDEEDCQADGLALQWLVEPCQSSRGRDDHLLLAALSPLSAPDHREVLCPDL